MNLQIVDWKEGAKPPVQLPDPGFMNSLGEKGIRKLISDHYDLLVKSDVKHLFPSTINELEKAKLRASDFFIQICGGYPFYNENRGNPMMTKRHEPFEITNKVRKIWLGCYKELLPELNVPHDYVISFWNYLNVFSLWMVNSPRANQFQNLKLDT